MDSIRWFNKKDLTKNHNWYLSEKNTHEFSLHTNIVEFPVSNTSLNSLQLNK